VATDSPVEAELQEIAGSLRTLAGESWARILWADFEARFEPVGRPLLHLPGVPLHPTSGTTAEPRVAVRPAATAVAEARHYVRTIGVDAGDRILAMAPMSHAFGHGWYVVTPMVTGASLVSMRRFNAALGFRAYKEQEITLVPAVAAMLAVLMFGAGDRLYGPGRRVITGGAPLPERTALNFERISGTRVRPLYGTTEAGAIAVARADDERAAHGRIGRPFVGVSVAIRTADDAAELGDGRGLVHVRSASVMAGYLRDESIDTSMLPEGWFSTGDLGWLDPEGVLHLCGRQAEVINVSGMKVLPSEVEEVIASMPGVAEVKVYAGKTRHGSHHVKAAVVVDDGVDATQIKAHCEKHLVYYKRPSRIILMDTLPRSSGGKILSDQLP
jgi:acyl-coenzyme A synthetase/AMP-(fatty) acid ligase